MDHSSLAEIDDWLVQAGLTLNDQQALIAGFAERLLAAGLPLLRVMVGTDLLHPTIGGRGYRWERDRGVSAAEYAREHATSPVNEDWIRSPFHHLIERRLPEIRRRLAIDYATGEFPLLDRLQREGATDYVAFVVQFGGETALGDTDGLIASVATDAARGFRDDELAALRRLVPRLALAFKTITGLITARTLLTTYLGSDAATRILKGSIGRGAAEMIRAVVWYSDLEGFTRLADTLPQNELVPFLNDYAECFVDAIHDHGGQVLKFMGDGILAMFPLADEATGSASALDAAIAAQRGSDRLFRSRSAAGAPVSRCFIGLHVGEMLYGNVGSALRLDFTVLGPAVNEASRIERLCRSLEQPIIMSQPFVNELARGREQVVSLGRYALQGVGRAQELYTLDPDILAGRG